MLIELVEDATSHVEAIWDRVADSDITKAYHEFQLAISYWRKYKDIRSALFASKVERFITDPSLQTSEARARMREQAESPENRKVGETLFIVLERLTDLLKPTWLARCYAGFLAGEFGSSQLRRLASAIDIAFGDDLVSLLTANEPIQPNEYAPWKRYLTGSGLTEIGTQGPIGGRTTFHVTELGSLFRNTVRKHSPPTE